MKQDLIPQLYAITSQVSHLALWLTILVVVFAPLERLFSAHQKNHWRLQIGNDLVYYFLNNLVPAILLSYPMSLLAWSVQRGDSHRVFVHDRRTTVLGSYALGTGRG